MSTSFTNQHSVLELGCCQNVDDAACWIIERTDLHAAELLWDELFTKSTDLSPIGLVNATDLDAAETLSNELAHDLHSQPALTYEA